MVREQGAGAELARVQAFANGLDVIRAFSGEAPLQTLAEVARVVGTPRATARRALQTLEVLGYAETDGHLWKLTPRILELGYAYLSSESTWDVVTGHLARLAGDLQESATAGVLDGADVVYTARVAVRRIMTMTVGVGSKLPAHATAIGRVLLASLPQSEFDSYLEGATLRALTERTVTDRSELARIIRDCRRSGTAVVDQELEMSVRSAAAPIHDRSGTTVGAIQICCHASNVTVAQLRRRVLPEVQRVAGEIDVDLKFRSTTRELEARTQSVVQIG